MKTTKIQLIGARWLLTMSTAPEQDAEQNHVMENGGVLVQDDCIKAVGDYQTLLDELREQSTTEALSFERTFLDDHILLPGLVNNHGHLAMSLLRGLADDLPLQTWLQDHIWPCEAEWVSPDFVRDGSDLAMAEMVLSGTTTFSDMYFFPEQCAQAAEANGLRANIFFPIMEFPCAWGSGPNEYFDKGLQLFDQYKHSDAISIGFGPHAPYTVSNATFEKVATVSAELGASIQTHLHESAQEIQDSLKEYKQRPLARLNQLGIINARTQAVHVTQIQAEEIDTLAEQGCSVIHCPSSNSKLASGFPPIQAMLNANIKLGLGTDGAASNNSLDLFEEARLSSLVSKLTNQDAASLPAYTALYAATHGGAIAAGQGDTTGSLEAGKKADFIAIDTLSPKLQPMLNPVSQLTNTAAGSAVNYVWVNGEQIVNQGQLCKQDMHELLERVSHWQNRLNA